MVVALVCLVFVVLMRRCQVSMLLTLALAYLVRMVRARLILTDRVAVGCVLVYQGGYVALGMALIDRFSRDLMMIRVLLVHLAWANLTMADQDWVGRGMATMTDLVLLHLSYTYIPLVQFRLVHLGLVDLFHLTWNHLGLVDRGVFDGVRELSGRAFPGLIHVAVIHVLQIRLLGLGEPGCARLPLTPRSTAVDIFLVDLYEAAVGTRHPVPRR